MFISFAWFAPTLAGLGPVVCYWFGPLSPLPVRLCRNSENCLISIRHDNIEEKLFVAEGDLILPVSSGNWQKNKIKAR
jgi:hypothetical protein